MKNKKIFKKITCMFFVILCILSCFNFTAFADEINPNAEYGEDIGGNIIPLPTGTGQNNTFVSVPNDNRNADTLIFLMDYMQYLYSYNMTNGQRPVLIVFRSDRISVYCVPVDREFNYVTNVTISNYYRVFTFATTNIQAYNLLEYGNFSIDAKITTNKVQVDMRPAPYTDYYGYIYLNADGETYTYYATSTVTDGVYYPLVEMYLNMKNFIEQTGSSLPDLSVNTTLDIGSIISSVMSAPMIIFGGLTGSPGNLSQSLELFGIDIRATLISLLVIAIVIFIIKFLRGG